MSQSKLLATYLNKASAWGFTLHESNGVWVVRRHEKGPPIIQVTDPMQLVYWAMGYERGYGDGVNDSATVPHYAQKDK